MKFYLVFFIIIKNLVTNKFGTNSQINCYLYELKVLVLL